MRKLNEIIENVLDQLAPLPSGPLTPLDTPVQDANQVLMAEFGIEPPVYRRPTALPRTVEEMERRRARQLLLVRLGEMIRQGEVRPRHPLTGDPVLDLGWDIQPHDYNCLFLDDADEARFRDCYPALRTASDEAPDPDRGDRQASKLDDLQIELLGILEEMSAADERITAGTVMPKLRARAGERTTCVVEKCPEGVIWSRSRGDVEKLTSKALQGRIDRWRGKKPR